VVGKIGKEQTKGMHGRAEGGLRRGPKGEGNPNTVKEGRNTGREVDEERAKKSWGEKRERVWGGAEGMWRLAGKRRGIMGRISVEWRCGGKVR